MHPNSPKLSILVNFFDFSYIVPEYSFLDARGLGAYEGKSLESISEVGFLPVSVFFKTSAILYKREILIIHSMSRHTTRELID